MVTGIIALVTALASLGVAYLGYRERHAKSTQEKVDDAKDDVDDRENDFKEGGGRLGKKK